VSRNLLLLQQNGSGRESIQSDPIAYEKLTRNDMPVFPIAADDYLRKEQFKAVVVKRDFQNDMLILDPEAKGELMLIRDPRIPDEMQTLLIVPRVTQFQMRQEYYNFYERYFDCRNPESGAVWILAPGTVDKVSGGWQLRDKGKLEIR